MSTSASLDHGRRPIDAPSPTLITCRTVSASIQDGAILAPPAIASTPGMGGPPTSQHIPRGRHRDATHHDDERPPNRVDLRHRFGKRPGGESERQAFHALEQQREGRAEQAACQSDERKRDQVRTGARSIA